MDGAPPHAPVLDSLLPVGPVPAEVPGGAAVPLWEDSLPVRERSGLSSLRQLGCLGGGAHTWGGLGGAHSSDMGGGKVGEGV